MCTFLCGHAEMLQQQLQQYCTIAHCAELRLSECYGIYIFSNSEMDKGSQKPVDSQAVCRQHTAVLLWPIQLFHSVGQGG